MKRMCLVMLAALAIIICVIAVQNFRETREEVYDGILIEKNLESSVYNCYALEMKEENGGV